MTGTKETRAIELRGWFPRKLFPRPLSRRARNFAFVLLGIDILFMATYAIILISFGKDIFDDPVIAYFDLGVDRGIPEFFNYLKLGLVVLILTAIYRQTRTPLYLVFALCYTLVVLDDAIGIHERLGVLLANGLSLPDLTDPRMRGQDLGELLAFAIAGVVIVVGLVIGWFATRSDQRGRAVVFVFLLAGLAFFAIGVDVLSQAIGGSVYVGLVLYLLEDGGEMLVVTLSCAVALGMLGSNKIGQALGEAER